MLAEEALQESDDLILSRQQYIFLYGQQVQERLHHLHWHYFIRKGLLITRALK